jgi:hypothetical protein
LALRRRQLFLTSFIDDPFGTTGRGSRVYLAGWTDESPLGAALDGANWNAQDTTLYLIELETELTPEDEVTISPDQFTWVVREYLGLGDTSPINLTLQPGEEAVFQYTPIPGAVLSRVDELTVRVDNVATIGRITPVEVWDWTAGAWEPVLLTGEVAVLQDPAPYLGARNAVRLRILTDESGTFTRIGRVSVSQSGAF